MVEHGIALGRVAAAVSTILDPSILVVGGGLSRNEEFAGIILEEFRRRSHATVTEISKKGAEVTVTGACMLARDLALRQIVDKFHKPLLSRPTLLQAASSLIVAAPVWVISPAQAGGFAGKYDYWPNLTCHMTQVVELRRVRELLTSY